MAEALPNNAGKRPLCVDLDGTLARTDTALEALVRLGRAAPWLLLLVPFWWLRGKAYLKEQIGTRIDIEAAWLPWNGAFLEWLRAQVGERPLILCTGAHRNHAGAVAKHLEFFDEVLATEPGRNLTGRRKRDALVERYGEQGFDYAGDSTQDLPVFAAAHDAIVVNPTLGLRARLGRIRNLTHRFDDALPGIGLYIKQIRLYQWAKNALLLVPVMAAHRLTDVDALMAVGLGIIAFGCVASSTYVVNDLMDLREDRRHPRKRERPFASGRVPIGHGLPMAMALLLTGIAIASTLPTDFQIVLLVYAFTTVGYNILARSTAVADTLVLAGLYTLRIVAGAAVIQVEPSFWLLAFSMFFFLGAALAKRYAELLQQSERAPGKARARQYEVVDLESILAQGTSAGYASVVLAALYINSEEVQRNYANPELIWLACPLLLYWINKMWLDTRRGRMHDDPVVWALKNRVSRFVGFLCVLILVAAA